MRQAPSALRIGTRASRLALVQAEEVQKRLQKSLPDEEIILVKIRTTGDRTRTKPLSAMGGEGVFTKEIQRALLDQCIDVAVHSLKDLPTQQPPELIIAAIPERVMPNDVLISFSGDPLAELPEGSTVATGSLRRKAQILAHRPDFRVTEIRGNVDTRLRKLRRGDADAIILAWAGLHRLGLEEEITEVLPFEIMLPAAGQGALGIEMRKDDPRRKRVARALHHRPSAVAVTAERKVLSGLGGGCRVPIAILAEVQAKNRLRLRAAFSREEDGRLLRAEATGPAKNLDRVVADILAGLGR